MITYQLKDPALGDPAVAHRLVTTLLDAEQYPAVDLVCAYHDRWEIELVIDQLDTHQRVVGRPLRSHHPVGGLQELYGLLIAHYVVRMVMHDAALAHEIDPDRISFVHAIRLIQDAISAAQMIEPESHTLLYHHLLMDIGARLLPPRRLRMYPRLVKQKMTTFLRKRPDDPLLLQPTLAFRAAVALVVEELTPIKPKRPRGRPKREA